MKILITGAGGYAGSLLVEHFLSKNDVEKVIAVDVKKPSKEIFREGQGKLAWETGRLDDKSFISSLKKYLPVDIVIHAAFIIRAGYGEKGKEVERINLESCKNVFDFCFNNGVKKLVYFSTASIYGAMPGNVKDRFFKETDPLREDVYPYGAQKKKVEEMLLKMHKERNSFMDVIVLRPGGITGPWGQMEDSKKISLISFLKKYLPLIPKVSDEWTRQFIHEDDLIRAIDFLINKQNLPKYDVFNLVPPGYLTADDMAKILGKKTIRIPAWFLNLAFNTLWHLTRGKMPTPPGSINFYKYPINLDGSKLTRLGFHYRYSSKDALLAK